MLTVLSYLLRWPARFCRSSVRQNSQAAVRSIAIAFADDRDPYQRSSKVILRKIEVDILKRISVAAVALGPLELPLPNDRGVKNFALILWPKH